MVRCWRTVDRRVRSDVVGVSAAENVSDPQQRVSNHDRRPPGRRTSPRAAFPLMSGGSDRLRAVTALADLDTSDPSAGGGRGFTYEWEVKARQLTEQIADLAAGGGISYTHHQTVPAAQWVIDHHMGLIPNVFVLDSSGLELMAEIRHPSDQTTVVVHSVPYTGTAYLRP